MGSELTDSVSDQPRLEDPVYEQHDNNRKENRIRADKSQYILIGKDYLDVLPDRGRKVLK